MDGPTTAVAGAISVVAMSPKIGTTSVIHSFSLAPYDYATMGTNGRFILFPQVTSWENWRLAYRKAARGKPSAAALDFQLADKLLQLQDELHTGSYRSGPYQHFVINEPKRRLISAAPFRDRVVHHALCNIIEPLFEARFHLYSYANRVGKGTHGPLPSCKRMPRLSLRAAPGHRAALPLFGSCDFAGRIAQSDRGCPGALAHSSHFAQRRGGPSGSR